MHDVVKYESFMAVLPPRGAFGATLLKHTLEKVREEYTTDYQGK